MGKRKGWNRRHAAITGLLALLAGATAYSYFGPVEQYCENGEVRMDFGAQRVLVDQSAARGGCLIDQNLPWIGGGTVHTPWQPFSLTPNAGSLVVTRALLDGGLQGSCDTLVQCCHTTCQVPVPVRTVGAVSTTIGYGYDPAARDLEHGTCNINFSDGAHYLFPLSSDQTDNKIATVCVVGPTAWTHPVPFPKSPQVPPYTVTVGVTVGPAATRLRSGGGFSGAVRLIVYDPDDPARRIYFTGEQLTLSASWDGRLFRYSPAQGDAVPQQSTDPPAYITATRYGTMVEVFTQDEVFATKATPTVATAYPNSRFTFDYHARPNDPTGSVNLTVYTPLD
jgi:hypothetical protein